MKGLVIVLYMRLQIVIKFLFMEEIDLLLKLLMHLNSVLRGGTNIFILSDKFIDLYKTKTSAEGLNPVQVLWEKFFT